MALVIVRTFGSIEGASLLAGRLAAAGIEAYIPESGTQPFSQVVPLDMATVRVAAKDCEAAEAVAAGMSGAGPTWAAAGAGDHASQPPRLPPPGRGLRLTRRGMLVISICIVGVPILFGIAVHWSRETAVMGPLFWLWALFSVVCFFWGRYVFRRYGLLAWACLVLALLQLISFSCLFLAADLPVNAQSQPYSSEHTRNPHNW
jgi:hypothetical protein